LNYLETKQPIYPMQIQEFTRAILAKISKKNKWHQSFFVHIVWLFLSLPGRYNFYNMQRYGEKAESTYRNHFAQSHDMTAFNFALIKEHISEECIWAFDPSYLSKSGKKTYGAGYFWSGCARKAKWGLEIGHIAAVDIHKRTAFHYRAIQTPAKLVDETPLEYYARIIIEQKEDLQSLSNVSVQDAFFSKKPFVDALYDAGFEVISRLRSDANLRYRYLGEQKGGKGKNIGKGKGSGGGRPKTYDGQVDTHNLREEHFQVCFEDKEKREIAYTAIVHAKALKRWIRVVVVQTLDEKGTVKSAKILFSTNRNRLAIDLLYYYRLRFQQEFLFRDAKQHIGLQDCQARSKEKIDFHVNMSLTALNVAKAVHHLPKQNEDVPFSMATIKTHYINELLLDKAMDVFIEVSGVDPNLIINNPKVRQLYNRGKIAA